jgi:hypothetical protein
MCCDKLRTIGLILLISWCSLVPVTAADDDILTIEELPSSIDLIYNRGTITENTYTFQVTSRPQNTEVVGWLFISITSGESWSFTPRRMYSNWDHLNYNIFDNPIDRNILMDIYSFNSIDNLLYTYIGSSQFNRSFSFTVEIPAGQDTYKKHYRDDDIYVEAWASFDDDPVTPDGYYVYRLDDQRVRFHTKVEDSILISVINPNAPIMFTDEPYLMDFGVLEPNKVQQCDLVVYSTTQYTLSVRSQHGGSMKHTNPNIDTLVPYDFFFDASLRTLDGSPSTILIPNTSPSSGLGDRYPIRIELNDFGWVPSGDYEDYLTFEVTSN